MKNLLLSLLFAPSFLCSAQELAPTVVSTAGDFYSNSDIQLTWTLGGSVLDSFSNNEVTISSGVLVEDVDTWVLDVNPQQANIHAFPNPLQHQLTLQFEDLTSNYQIIISDLTGRTVYTGFTSHSNEKIIDVSHLGIGAYALQILNENQQPIKKFKLSKTR